MKIIIDTMGSDLGPEEIIKGSMDALNEYDISLLLVGQEEVLSSELKKYTYAEDKVSVLFSNSVISNDDDPVISIRRKKDSSMVMGAKALADGLGDGMVSAGNTGALLSAATFIVKRIDGVHRAALAVMYPTRKGFSLLMDSGANVDSKPEYLVQFANMGSVYMNKLMGIDRPKVALANIGLEQAKGNELAKETYKLLEKENINFIGNIEARDIPEGVVDVIIADGFVGNIILKLTEGMAISIFTMLKEQIESSFISKLGGLLLKPKFKEMKEFMDYREYGGAPLLGVKKPMVKAHGSSDALAIKNAIRQMVNFIDYDVIETMIEEVN